jgi:hypothetical protein
MAYSTSDDLKQVYLASPLLSRKSTNMNVRPQVSLLFDNRTGNLKDHGDGLLVTARGSAAPASSVNWDRINGAFLNVRGGGGCAGRGGGHEGAA